MLAYEAGLSNKCVSERHIYASQRKLTAGEAAKLFTKMTGIKMLAKEIKELYIAHYGDEPEWHHSGFYRGNNGRTMGRTFFLSEEEVQTLAGNYAAIIQKRAETIARKEAEEKRKRETKVMGFYWTWDYDYSGNHGKKRNHKVLQAYEGDELHCPDHFTPCNAATLKRIKTVVGRKYYGWDDPKLEEFSKKAFDEEARRKAEREARLEAERKQWEEKAARRATAQEAYRQQMAKKVEENIEKFGALDLSTVIPDNCKGVCYKYFFKRDIKNVAHNIAAATGLDYQVCMAFAMGERFINYVESHVDETRFLALRQI